MLHTANGGRLRDHILGVLVAKPHFTADEVRTDCIAEFGKEIVLRHGEVGAMPPLRTFQHFLKALKVEEQVPLALVTNPDKHRSHFALSGTDAYSWVKDPNQLWQVDASPVDVMCLDGRHSIYLCIDIATRRVVITTSKTPRASAVNLMTRKALLAWGAPVAVKTDNGTDFTAIETISLLDALNIDVQRSTRYSPQEKGHVERAIKTFQYGFCTKQPGYIGHDVEDRKEIEARKAFAARLHCDDKDAFCVELTAAELQARIDRWVVDYETSEHEFVGLGKVIPAQLAAASVKPIRTVDERALDVLLMPLAGGGGIRTMSKKGLRIDHHYYQAPEILPRTQVFVRLDPGDAGIVRAYSPDRHEFLAVAVCYSLAGVNPVERLKEARAKRKAVERSRIDPAIAATRHIKPGDYFPRHMAVKEAEAAERMKGLENVVPLPRRTQDHSTPQIAAAIESFDAHLKGPRRAVFDDAAKMRHQRLVAELSGSDDRAGNVTPLRREEAPAQRFARMIEIERRRDAGAPLSEDEAHELGSYQQSSEYKSRKAMLEDSGDQAPVSRS
ncbi:transposase family protein [Mesorhizobium sp. J428]|uniref:transposase family protein n=1 Tax=Mesorhizobium sp. J428 TaxID=2898440 RepID=UPI0021508AD9|nr:transposase family protein [Mesorhizobium sp. J428]MCR5855960.1 transposase family protein [Mesorhizobium sp. J428]